jgi:transcription elongation factor Elf1
VQKGEKMITQGNNTVKCPKCEKEGSYLVSVHNGKQFVCCKACSNLFQAEVKSGQFTGKIM